MKRIPSFIIVVCTMLSILVLPVSALSESNWAMKYVDFCINNNNMFREKTRTSITTTETFKRQEVVYALMKIEGVNASIHENPVFSDVAESSYYNGAINWAYYSGIVTGAPGGLFLPGNDVAKKDLLIMIYRYLVEYSGITLPSNSYSDLPESALNGFSEPVKAKLESLYDAGIITGDENSQFSFNQPTTTIEAAAFLTRAHGYRYIPDNTISVYVTTQSGSIVPNAAVVFCREGSKCSYDFNEYVEYYEPHDDDSMWIVMTNSSSFATFNTSQYGGRYGINAMSQYTSDFTKDYIGATKFHQLLVLPTNQYDWNIVSSYDNSTRLQIWPHNMYRSCKEASWAFPQWCPTALMDTGRNVGYRFGKEALEFHQGMDCGGYGESIYNTTGYDMYVEKIGTDANSPYGCYIKVFLLNTNYYIVYQHLSQINVFEKQTINKNSNTLIGKTGNTGNVDSHLHLTLTTLGDDILYSNDPTLVKKFKDPRILFK